MSIDYETIYPCLQKWACDATHINAYWRNQKNGAPSDSDNRSQIRLAIGFVETIGVDQKCYTEGDNGELIETDTGDRNLTISIQALTRSQTPNDIAEWYLEKLRTSLRMSSYLAEFASKNISFVEAGPIIPLDALFQNRWESIANIDIIFGVKAIDTDERGSLTVIDQAEVTSCIADVDGEQVPQSYQMVNQLIPEEVTP